LELLGNFECKEFELKLVFGNTCFTMAKGSKASSLPESVIELYGQTPQSDEEIAQRNQEYKQVKAAF
jgi:hypothetical protein